MYRCKVAWVGIANLSRHSLVQYYHMEFLFSPATCKLLWHATSGWQCHHQRDTVMLTKLNKHFGQWFLQSHKWNEEGSTGPDLFHLPPACHLFHAPPLFDFFRQQQVGISSDWGGGRVRGERRRWLGLPKVFVYPCLSCPEWPRLPWYLTRTASHSQSRSWFNWNESE